MNEVYDVLQFFNNEKGFYIDIGVYDGIKNSRTYILELNEWDGICIEGLEDIYNVLIKNRKCKCINAIISDEIKMINFNVNDYDSEIVTDIKSDSLIYERQTKTLSSILSELLLSPSSFQSHIDFLSINVNELNILKGFTHLSELCNMIYIRNINTHVTDYLTSNDFTYVDCMKVFISNKYMDKMYYCNGSVSKFKYDKIKNFYDDNITNGKIFHNKIVFNDKVIWNDKFVDQIYNDDYKYMYKNYICFIISTKNHVMNQESLVTYPVLDKFKINKYYVYCDDSYDNVEILTDCPSGIDCLILPIKNMNMDMDFIMKQLYYYVYDKDIDGIIKINDNMFFNDIFDISMFRDLKDTQDSKDTIPMSIGDIDNFCYVSKELINRTILCPFKKEIEYPFINSVGLFSFTENYVTIKLEAGFGNILFQVACLMGYAEKTNKIPIIVDELIVNQYHYSTDLCKKHIIKCFPDIKYVKGINLNNFVPKYFFAKYDQYERYGVYNYFDIPNYEGNIILEGRFMTDKFFPKLTIFKPNIDRNIFKIYDDYSDRYFLHFRMGDYIGNSFHDVDLDKYHDKCINNIISTMENDNIKFVVCYNGDKHMAIKKFEHLKILFKNITCVYQEQNDDPYNTLYIMSQCIGGICANSTLSWMGAYLLHLKGYELLYMPSKWGNTTNNDYIHIYPKWAKLISV